MKERVLPQNWGVLGDSLAVKANGWRMPEVTLETVSSRGGGGLGARLLWYWGQ